MTIAKVSEPDALFDQSGGFEFVNLISVPMALHSACEIVWTGRGLCPVCFVNRLVCLPCERWTCFFVSQHITALSQHRTLGRI